MDEAQTRRDLIDRNLRLAGWKLDDASQVIHELDIELAKAGYPQVLEPKTHPYEGHRFADYALLLRGKPCIVVEAKRTSRDAQLGQEQALQYAQLLQKIHHGPLPFISYTNGFENFFWESEFYPPSKVFGFPSRDDLEWMAERREGRRPLSVELIDTDIAGRDYQIAAIRTVLEQLEKKRRKFLLVMATGTGKTRVAVSLVELLMRARWAKRVLFLVDRIPLRDQALGAFKEHLPSEPRWPDIGDDGFVRNRRIYVATYPTMLNLIQAGTTPPTWISPYFFDLIVADESHRSIYNVYQQVVEYFHGLTLGLTATPRDHVDHDTFHLFECPVHDPTYAYSFDEAVRHEPPYLCDFEVLKVRSKFQLEGIKGQVLPPPVQTRLIADGLDLEDINFEGTDLEHKVTNSGTNALIVREFMEECIKDPSGTLPGKSIIFAISIGHARRIEQLFNDMYPEHRGTLARVLVSDDSRVYGKGGLLDQFKTRDFPRVAISVDLLDTGVDILEAVNLVFAKPVYSYVKFWQMIGRGTRVLDADLAKRRPWCTEKDRFLIFDCWGNFEYFDMHTAGREPGTLVPVPVRLFKAYLDRLETAIALSRADVVEATKVHLRAQLADLPANNVVVLDHQRDLAACDDALWTRLSTQDLAFLRTIVAPLLRTRTDAEFKALRFETDVVEYSTARLADNAQAVETLRDSILIQISELPLTVNVVARERALIEEVQRAEWWREPTDGQLDDLVRRLAPLMKYRQRPTEPMLKLNLEDLVVLREKVEIGPERREMSVAAYREKVERFVQGLVAENPVLQKLEAGQEPSDAELRDLAIELRAHDPYVTEELLRRIYDQRSASFLTFIRHILGLERLEGWSTMVSRRFDEFIAEHTTFTSLQIRFLQTLRTFVLQTRHLERRHLVELPFTQIHPRGIRGVFKPSEIDEIVAFAGKLVA